MRSFVHTAGITGASITFTLPPGTFFYVEPGLQVTVFGGITEVNAAFVRSAIAGAGEVITGVTLTFPPELVGKRFSLLLIGE